MGDKGRIYIPNQNMPRICPELAAEIGLNESILLLQLDYWISVAGKERDGRLWVFESLSDLQGAFPFWSRPTINRAVHSLEDAKLITTTNQYNQRKADKTRWFALNYEAIASLESVLVTDPELAQNDMPVTECANPEQNDTGPSQDVTAVVQNETTLPHDPHALSDLLPHQEILKGADAPPGSAVPIPTCWDDWEEHYKTVKNTPALVHRMIEVLYPGLDPLPGYGEIGGVAKKMGKGKAGYHRLMGLLWEHSKRPPDGDLLPYLLRVHQGKERDRAPPNAAPDARSYIEGEYGDLIHYKEAT